MEVLRKFQVVSVEVQWMRQPIVKFRMFYIFFSSEYVYPQLWCGILVHSRLKFGSCPWLLEDRMLGKHCLAF